VEKEVFVDPAALKLAQGELNILLKVWDYSRRGEEILPAFSTRASWTLSPVLRAVSHMHNVNVGGVGFAVYQTSQDAASSGVFVDDLFFPGYPDRDQRKKGFTTAISPSLRQDIQSQNPSLGQRQGRE